MLRVLLGVTKTVLFFCFVPGVVILMLSKKPIISHEIIHVTTVIICNFCEKKTHTLARVIDKHMLTSLIKPNGLGKGKEDVCQKWYAVKRTGIFTQSTKPTPFEKTALASQRDIRCYKGLQTNKLKE